MPSISAARWVAAFVSALGLYPKLSEGVTTTLVKMPTPCIDDGGDHLIELGDDDKICCSCQKRQQGIAAATRDIARIG